MSIKKFLPRIVLALMIVTCGVLWLVGGLNKNFNFDFGAFWPSLLIGLGLCFLVSSVCSNSPGYLYFFGVLVSFGILFLINNYATVDVYKIKSLWPFIIACPGIGSGIMFFVRRFNSLHLKMFILFVGTAVLLFLSSGKYVPWSIIIPIIVVLIGGTIFASIIFRRGRSWDTADNEYNGYKSYAEKLEDDTDKKDN